MKIIHVISSLTKGGGERVAVELANKAAEKGDEVTIIAAWPVNPVFLQNDLNASVDIKFIGKTKGLAYFKIIFWILKHKSWISSKDVLHCHLTFGAVFGSAVSIMIKLMGKKKSPIIVETYHAVGMPIPKFNRWAHSRMVLLRDGLVLMATDPYWNNFIIKTPGLKIAIIPNGISVLEPQKNIELKQQFLKELGIEGTYKYIVGTVSNLRPDRQPWLYIPIFKEIHKSLGNDVQFILAGDGVEFDKIKGLVKQHGLLGYVHMPGFVNNPALPISNMDIYVSVSVGETTGISMVEAAMCQKPIVAIQLVESYHAKKEDWVWSHTDTKEVAKKIIFLLQNKQERNTLADKQNKFVINSFTSEAMYNSYNSFYKEILA